MKNRFKTTVFLLISFLFLTIVSCQSSNYVKVRQYLISGDAATPLDQRNFDVYIVATGDVAAAINQEDTSDDVISAGTLSDFVATMRKFSENTLVVDTGNFLYGTRYASGNSTFNKTNGESMVEVARKVSYNAMNVGGDDILYSATALSRNIAKAKSAVSGVKAEDSALELNEVYYVSQNDVTNI